MAETFMNLTGIITITSIDQVKRVPFITIFKVNLNMQKIEEIEKAGIAAVKKLRQKKLQSGIPFMINSKELPGNQCYLEYPDGSMML